MYYTFLLVICLIALFWAYARGKAEKDEERERLNVLRDDAKRRGAKSFDTTDYSNSKKVAARDHIYEDVETGNHYRQRMIGDHWCRFTLDGHLIEDCTQKKLDEQIGRERERAEMSGRRLYMVDNRAGCTKDGISRVRYRDLLNGEEYILGRFSLHTIVLINVNTLMVYDVLKQKDGRGYLRNPYTVDQKELGDLKSFIGRLNYDLGKKFFIEDKISLLYKKHFNGSYVRGYDPRDDQMELAETTGTYWSNMLEIEVRDEFKETKDFPLVMFDPLKQVGNGCQKAESLV